MFARLFCSSYQIRSNSQEVEGSRAEILSLDHQSDLDPTFGKRFTELRADKAENRPRRSEFLTVPLQKERFRYPYFRKFLFYYEVAHAESRCGEGNSVSQLGYTLY